ncbi:MAG: NAD(P)H-hydrate dehydratase [Candidatus Aenigmarchaeota archaeon]|nr:NAD(P)H-hydrate dehydratase [Candidatus Aenigmarchaeota archaeon]
MVVFVNRKILSVVYAPRPKESRKGDFGRVLVVGGSYTGAPALVAMAALRSGADIVRVAAPWKQAGIIAGFSPNIITEELDSSHIESQHVKNLIELSKKSDVISIGSGLGEKSKPAAKSFISKCDKPMVVDAEAIPLLRGIKKKHVIITPHATEFEMLAGEHLPKKLEERTAAVEKLSSKLGTILLKGPVDIISNGIKTAHNTTGNPYMTVGGTGDVLAGICASLLAQKTDVFYAACAAAYINGFAGDLAAKRLGPSMLATDVVDEIANAIRIR